MSPLAAQLIWLCRVEVGSEGENVSNKRSLLPQTYCSKWWLFPNTGNRNQHQPVTPNLGESISAGRERARVRILSHPAPHQRPKPPPRVGFTPSPISCPLQVQAFTTQSSQPQKQTRSKLVAGGPGMETWPSWPRRMRGAAPETHRPTGSGCPAAERTRGIGPLIPRAALARVSASVCWWRGGDRQGLGGTLRGGEVAVLPGGAPG